jgi:hypothetical protein
MCENLFVDITWYTWEEGLQYKSDIKENTTEYRVRE